MFSRDPDPMFDKAKQMYDLQKQAKEMRTKLQAMTFTAETAAGDIRVVMNGEQDVKELTITMSDKYVHAPDLLAREVKDVVNKALEKSKKGAAESMRAMMGGTGLMGM